MGKSFIKVEYETFNKALNILLDADMPAVVFRKDDRVGMANDAVEALRARMREVALFLKRGQEEAEVL